MVKIKSKSRCEQMWRLIMRAEKMQRVRKRERERGGREGMEIEIEFWHGKKKKEFQNSLSIWSNRLKELNECEEATCSIRRTKHESEEKTMKWTPCRKWRKQKMPIIGGLTNANKLKRFEWSNLSNKQRDHKRREKAGDRKEKWMRKRANSQQWKWMKLRAMVNQSMWTILHGLTIRNAQVRSIWMSNREIVTRDGDKRNDGRNDKRWSRLRCQSEREIGKDECPNKRRYKKSRRTRVTLHGEREEKTSRRVVGIEVECVNRNAGRKWQQKGGGNANKEWHVVVGDWDAKSDERSETEMAANFHFEKEDDYVGNEVWIVRVSRTS